MPGDELTFPIQGKDVQQDVKEFLRQQPQSGRGTEFRDAVHQLQRVDTESKGGIRREIRGGIDRLKRDVAQQQQKLKDKVNEAAERVGVGPVFGPGAAVPDQGGAGESIGADTANTGVRDP